MGQETLYPIVVVAVCMHHLGAKDVRTLGSITTMAMLVPGHHRMISQTVIGYLCLEQKILAVTT